MSRKFDSQSGSSSCGSVGKKRAEDWKKSGDKKGGSQRDGSVGGAGNTNTGPVGT